MSRIPVEDANENDNGQSVPEPDGAKATADSDATVHAGAGGADVQKLRLERDSLFQQLARANADFKNTQRRLEQDLEQRVQYANSSLIKSLLPVIDNFERALAVDSAKADAASILKGMQIVHDQWLNVLMQQKVEEIAPAPGTPFDANLHQAVMQQDAVYPVPTVVQLFAKGYTLQGRTLRPAQVAVSKSV